MCFSHSLLVGMDLEINRRGLFQDSMLVFASIV